MRRSLCGWTGSITGIQRVTLCRTNTSTCPASSSSSSSSLLSPLALVLSKMELCDHAFIMQHLLLAQLFCLGGGQRCQVYAYILLGDINRRKGKLVLQVPAEKVAQLNCQFLPLPSQLWTSIEFFIHYI